MIEIVRAEPSHLELIKPRDCHASEEMPNHVMGAVTFLLNGEPIAIIGGAFVATRVLQVWGILSDGVKLAPVSFHRSVKTLLNHQIRVHELQRVQMSVKVGFMPGWRWAEKLDFICEGVMKTYGPGGEDYWLFARTKWER